MTLHSTATARSNATVNPVTKAMTATSATGTLLRIRNGKMKTRVSAVSGITGAEKLGSPAAIPSPPRTLHRDRIENAGLRRSAVPALHAICPATTTRCSPVLERFIATASVWGLVSGCAASVTATEVRDPTPPSAVDREEAGTNANAESSGGAVAEPSGHAVRGVDHVALTVTDLEASKSLFVDVLGFRVRGQDKDYPAYFLTNGHTTITLWRAAAPDSTTPFDRRKNVGLHHLALAVDSLESLDALHERLATAPGVVIEFPPELAYGGPAKHMMFYEPSGNRIELVHRPAP